MTLPFRARLYFLYSPGCPHCTAAEPHVAKFQIANPVKVLVTRVNASKREELLGFRPKGTPAYLMLVGDEKVWRHEGMLTAAELQAVFEEVERRINNPPGEDDEDAVPKKKGRGKATKAHEEEE